MSQTFAVRYTLTPGDYVAFSGVFLRLTPYRRLARYLVVFITIAALIAAAYLWQAGETFFAAYALFIAALMVFAVRVIEPWQQRRSYEKQHLGEHEITFRADDDGISLTTPVSNGRSKWSALRQVDETPGHIILWPNDRLGYIVPKRAFASDAEAQAFARLAKEKTVGQKL